MIRPIFQFAKNEKWFPVGVEESLSRYHIQWERMNADFTTVRRLNFPKDMKQPSLPTVVYHRDIEREGLVWNQYWLWYLYNPWGIAGIGPHEGDWEFVQIATTIEDEVPVAMTCSQHHSGGRRDYWTVELYENRPVIYVALGSHANYFSSGNKGIDTCDYEGYRMSNYETREFGAWKDWPGRWGNSTGEGKSPESPGNQTLRWRTPHLFHSSAK